VKECLNGEFPCWQFEHRPMDHISASDPRYLPTLHTHLPWILDGCIYKGSILSIPLTVHNPENRGHLFRLSGMPHFLYFGGLKFETTNTGEKANTLNPCSPYTTDSAAVSRFIAAVLAQYATPDMPMHAAWLLDLGVQRLSHHQR
jgi:hypothetical protein